MRAEITRILSIVAFLAQAIILDYYIISKLGQKWIAVVVADILTVSIMIWSFIFAHRYFAQFAMTEQDIENRRRGYNQPRVPGLLPSIFIAWFVYSSFLVMKIVMIFKTFGPDLSGEDGWGTNLLEFVITGTAGIFAFLIAGRERHPTPSQKSCLKFMQHHVLIEIIDCVEFLTILFTAEHNLMVPTFVTDLILGFGCVNLILPTIGLYQLSAQNFNQPKPRENFYVLQTVLSTIFGNLPFLIIRVFLWTDHQFTNALFVMKNIIAICQNIVELVHYFTRDRKKVQNTKHTLSAKKLFRETDSVASLSM